MKQKMRAYLSALLCTMMCVTGILGFNPVTASAAETDTTKEIHVYADTPGDVESSKYTLTADGTEVPVVKYQANGNNFDIARFSSDDVTPEYTVNVPNEEINTVTVYPERYYPQDSIQVSEDRHSVTFQLSEKLRYCFVMINGGPADQAGKPYLAIINDPTETDKPDMNASNVLNFQTFMEAYLEEHPNSEAQEAEPAGTTSGGVSYEAGKLVANNTAQVRFPDKRQMTEDDATYALQAALDEIYKEGSPYDTLYFPAGTYTYSGLEIRNRKGKHVTIYVEEGALLKNRIQECMQAMEPAIGIWDSSNITISGRGIFDGNGVENYRMDRHDAKDSCHQGGVMIVRSSNITFNDTYVRDAKQWNWESHGSKNCTLNNIKGLTPYNQPWVDGLDMASAQDLTINGALTLGNDDNFASGHYNPSDGFPNTVPGFDQYNSDALEWDTEDSFNVSVNNTLGWSYNGGNGVRMGHNTYGHQMKNYTFTNVNTTNFTGGGRGITVQNSTGTYPKYESIIFKDCSFDTTRVGRNFQILGKDPLIDTVTLDNCWFSNGEAVSEAANIENLTIKDLYIGGKKVEVSNFANLTTSNITNFSYDWEDNHEPEFTAPTQTSYEVKVGQEITFDVAAEDADDGDTVTLSADDIPDGAKFDAAEGVFTWTPSENQMGSHEIIFTAVDSKNVQVTKKITFTVKDKVGNTAPVFAEFEGNPYTVNAGDTLTFQVSAEDAESDAVTLSIVGDLPRGAAFDAVEGVFTWTTSASQTGSREITFEAVDSWGAFAQAAVTINVETGVYTVVDISPAEDTYMASWKDEKNKNYEGNEYLRVRRMTESIEDTDTYGLWGEKVTSTSDSKDAKISVLKFDAVSLRENLDNLEKAELELTLINKRNGSGSDRLMAAAVTGDWDASAVTWNTHPVWDTDTVKYSDEFSVDTYAAVQNTVAITNSSYDGTKVTVDVTEFVKNLKDTDTTLSIAVCDEKGYELAFASTEGAAKLDESKNAAPLLRMTVKKEAGPEKEVGRVIVSEDSFVGSWSGDRSKNFGTLNFLRAAYDSNSTGVLGTESGSDNKVTYLKYDLSSLNTDEFDRAKLQLTLLGVRKNDAANQEAELLVGMAEDTEWTESSLTWNNKPQIVTGEEGLSASEMFKLGDVVHNDPAQITAPEGTVATVDVTEFVLKAKEEGWDSLTLVVNIDNSNSAMTAANANRIYFVSKEGAQNYADAAGMAPTLLLTKYSFEEEPVLSGIALEAPAKTDYKTGETLDVADMSVTASYSDGSTKEIALSDIEITGFDSETAGVKTVNVTYGGKTATFEAAVRALSVIKVDNEPVKEEYILGDELDITGMKVTAVYVLGDISNPANKKEYDVTDAVKVTGFDSAKAGELNLEVNYEDKRTELATVTVKDELPEEAVLSELRLEEVPIKTDYEAGDTLDLTGLKLTGIYNYNNMELLHDLTVYVIENQKDVVTGYNAEIAGDQSIRITVDGQSTEFVIKVNEQPAAPTLSRIEIIAPKQTEYNVGEELNLDGIVVTAYYSDGSQKDVTEEVLADSENAITGFHSVKAGNVTVKVTYEDQTAEFTVVVQENILVPTGINLTAPTKTEYAAGDSLDLAGMKVIAVYDDGTETDVTDEAEVAGFDSSKAGEVIVTVSYGGFAQTFTICITEKGEDDNSGDDSNNKPGDTPGDNPDNKSEDKPGTDIGNNTDNNVNVDKNDRPGSSQTANGDKAAQNDQTSNAVKTSDSSHAAGYTVILALAIFAAAIGARKKLNYKK